MRYSQSISVLILVVVGLIFFGCGEDKTVEVEKPPAIVVTVTASSSDIAAGQTVTLTAEATTSSKAGELSYSWSAPAGVFSDANGISTDWIAPGDPLLYQISCVVKDNDDVGIGKINIAVDTYLPTDTPFYEGQSYCATCHSGGPGGDQYTSWSTSGHAHALATLEAIGQGQNGVCLACHTVGSNGLFADPDLDNRGYNDMSVEAFANVQCENCHGPASGHPGIDSEVDVTLDAAMCGDCHNGSHHPTYDEWLISGHGSNTVGFAARRTDCAKCHNGLEGPRYLDDPGGYTDLSAAPTEVVAHTCATCHDPHGNDNPGYLRDASVTDVLIPNNILITDAGLGRLCISCHNGRRQDYDVIEQIEEGSDHFGPHHSVQGDMLAGENAYEAVNPSFEFATSKHLLVEDGCVHCHTHEHEGEEAAFTGHTFEPTVEACIQCHGPIDSFEGVLAKRDYDGNGSIEGVQLEVQGLLTLLQATIAEEADPLHKPEFEDIDTFADAVGDTLKSTVEMREAGYNWAYVSYDGSSGVHNTTYSVQLLQQSILFLDPTALPSSAYVLKNP